ncbi:MAG: siroheme synthase, partial [Betaproteobacteria bacterium HGW-Betaproteobacteria-2]
RDYAQSCLFTTGHLKASANGEIDSVELDWPALTRPNQTVVIYMGLVGLAEICRKLVLHGLPAETPAAVVQQGTTVRQRVVVADLATLAEKVSAAELKPPCLIIVGGVVALHEKLAWFRPGSDV